MAPERVKVPVPTFVKLPVLLITPLKVVSGVLPAVRLRVKVMLPAPASEAIVSSAPTTYVAPLLTVTAVLLDKVPVTFKVPAETVVVPV